MVIVPKQYEGEFPACDDAKIEKPGRELKGVTVGDYGDHRAPPGCGVVGGTRRKQSGFESRRVLKAMENGCGRLEGLRRTVLRALLPIVVSSKSARCPGK